MPPYQTTPENSLLGTEFTLNRSYHDAGDPILVSSAYAGLRLWRNTAVANLQPNQSLNLGTDVLGYEWDVNPAINAVPLWGTNVAPLIPNANDASPTEVGVQFQSQTNGYVLGVRFYKGNQNTGTHVGHLWTASGTLLATATFTNESATGWQQVLFSNPVAVTAGTTYVASYYAPNGRYSVDPGYFMFGGYSNGPLTTLPDKAAASGTLLGAVTFTNESASGWQEADFSSPIAVTAGTTYVVSYFAPNGHYAGDNRYFANSGVDTGVLNALSNQAANGNGVYLYDSDAFPTKSFKATNYWVDVVFNSGG